jgi:hypothetical protein
MDADATQLTFPGMEAAPAEDLTAIDKLHLLYALDRRGALTGGLIARWGKDRTFVELARRVARYLDPKDKTKKVYERIAEALGGRRTMRMM